MVKEQSLSSLIKKLDDVFSEYVRIRDAKPFSGLVHCFVCGVAIPWRSSQAMHWIDRDFMVVRYEEINVHAGCAVCNCLDSNHRMKYTNQMVKVYGVERVNNLKHTAQSMQKFMRIDLYELIGVYKGEIKQLRKQKHL